jgi:hypothetical protein
MAVHATKRFLASESPSVRMAWDSAVRQHSDSPSSQEKGCPRDAFLVLCEAGLVKSVPPGNHGAPRENVNGRYAVDAYHLLKANPKFASDTKALWNANPDRTATHGNGQLDVLLMMYAAGQLK